jgi:hypothetical protein
MATLTTFDNPNEALRSHIDYLIDLNGRIDPKGRTDIPYADIPYAFEGNDLRINKYAGNDLRIDKYADRIQFSVIPLAEWADKNHDAEHTDLSLVRMHIRTMESASKPISEFHTLLTNATTADTRGFFTYHDQVRHGIWDINFRMPLADISYDNRSSSLVLSIHDNNCYKIYVKVEGLATSRGREPVKASLQKGWAGNWERFVGNREPIENYQDVPLIKILKAPFIAKTLKTIGTEYEEVTIQQVQKEFNTIHEKVTANIFEGLAERLQLGRVEYDELMQIKVAYDDCWDRLAELCGMIKKVRRGEEEGEGEKDGEDEPPKKKKRC